MPKRISNALAYAKIVSIREILIDICRMTIFTKSSFLLSLQNSRSGSNGVDLMLFCASSERSGVSAHMHRLT